MGSSLTEIAQTLKNSNKKVQLIYAFNGTGKTRLSREFKSLINANTEDSEVEEIEIRNRKILYYNAFTEDLFYWDNDLENDNEPKLKIQPNDFTEWIFVDQGQDQNVIRNFQHYNNPKLTPRFNPDFSEITFSYARGNDEYSHNIKISKGEESNFFWSIFYSLIEQVVEVLNVPDPTDRETNQFDKLEYVFIDDPVSSLDDNHVMKLAVNLAELIKYNESDLKFIVTTHNPIFYNILHNELNNSNKSSGYKHRTHFQKYRLENKEDNTYELIEQSTDTPFSYHLFLKNEIEKAIETDRIYKYHFNFLRNILEKTATFFGYSYWGDLLIPIKGDRIAYEKRIIDFSSHSKHSAEEIILLSKEEKSVLIYLVKEITKIYNFQ